MTDLLTGRTALVFGNEAHGLGDEWSRLCHRRVTIPMQRGTDSLNVAVAAGIFLYHFAQSGLQTGTGSDRSTELAGNSPASGACSRSETG